MKGIARTCVLLLAVGFVMASAARAQVVPVPPVKGKMLPTAFVPTPRDLTAAQEKESVKLSWQDRSSGRAACSIERKTGKDGVYKEIATVTAGFSNYKEQVQAGQSYVYRVRAYTGSGKERTYSGYSNEVSMSVPAMVTLRPALTRPTPEPKIVIAPKVLTIPAVINVPGTMTVTGGKPPAAPTAALSIPAVMDVQGTLTVTGGRPPAAPTAVLTIPAVVNVTTTLTVSGPSQ